jgi:hypothetical protein
MFGVHMTLIMFRRTLFQDAKVRVEVTIVHASDDFHVINANINFGQELDVKAI